MTYDLITLDVGGTLLYPWPSVGEIYANCFLDHGLDACPNEINQSFKIHWKKTYLNKPHKTSSEKYWWYKLVELVVADLGEIDDFKGMFDDLWDRFASPEHWRLYDGVIEQLEFLKKQNCQLAILSNWDERLRPLLTELDLNQYFDYIFISCEVGVEKPDIKIFKHVEAETKVQSQKILHIGDSDFHDIKGAQSAGWQARKVKSEARSIDLGFN